MSQARNPFHWRGTVTAGDAFVGRKRELGSIFTRLQTLGCVSVVGERRIGKSSLAYQASAHVASELGSNGRAVYIDMLSARHHSLTGLLWAILAGLGGRVGEVEEESSAAAMALFESEIRELRRQGCLLVVVLDEFEALGARTAQFGDDLLESWRSLGNDGQMAFVTTSARPLDELTQESGLTSSFYNIFAQMGLKEFTKEEAGAFTRRAVRVGEFEPADEAFMTRVGQQHPLRLQVAAWHLFEARRRGDVDFGLLAEQAEEEIAGMMRGK